MSEEEHVHVVTDCKACGLSRAVAGKSKETMTTIPASSGIPEVPATYTFIAEGAHENKSHQKEMIKRVFGKNNPKHTPYYTPMKSRIVNFTHGKDHNEA
jgi:hypothetical protein